MDLWVRAQEGGRKNEPESENSSIPSTALDKLCILGLSLFIHKIGSPSNPKSQ